MFNDFLFMTFVIFYHVKGHVPAGRSPIPYNFSIYRVVDMTDWSTVEKDVKLFHIIFIFFELLFDKTLLKIF